MILDISNSYICTVVLSLLHAFDYILQGFFVVPFQVMNLKG